MMAFTESSSPNFLSCRTTISGLEDYPFEINNSDLVAESAQVGLTTGPHSDVHQGEHRQHKQEKGAAAD